MQYGFKGFLCCLLLLAAFAVHGQPNLPHQNLGCFGINEHFSDKILKFALYHSSAPGQLAITTHNFSIDNKNFQIQSKSQATGLLAMLYSGQLTQHSEGQILKNQGLSPRLYSEKKGDREQEQSIVNEANQTVTFTKNNESTKWRPNAQDRLSLIYQLSAYLNCSSNPKNNNPLTVPIITTGRIEQETFHLKTQTIVLKTNNQQVNALVLSNEETTQEDIIRLWFDADKNYLPVQIQVQDKKGKQVTQVIKR